MNVGNLLERLLTRLTTWVPWKGAGNHKISKNTEQGGRSPLQWEALVASILPHTGVWLCLGLDDQQLLKCPSFPTDNFIGVGLFILFIGRCLQMRRE